MKQNRLFLSLVFLLMSFLLQSQTDIYVDVWEDVNGDGTQDEVNDLPQEITITLYEASGNTIVSAATTSVATIFHDVPAGMYYLHFSESITWSPIMVLTKTGMGTNITDSDGDPITGNTPTFLISASGPPEVEWDAGYVVGATIGDYVWQDANANGIQEISENNNISVQLKLLNTDNTPAKDLFGFNAEVISSGASGNYIFTNIRPGNYKIKVSLPPIWLLSPSNASGGSGDLDDAIDDSDANPTTFVTHEFQVNSQMTKSDIDFGVYKNLDIGGSLWIENDKNGMFDVGENELPSIAIGLNNENGEQLVSTTTNNNGEYHFNQVPPGKYKIAVLASNFGEGGRLNGLSSCDGSKDANIDVDNDDNGEGPAEGPLKTTLIELLSGEEPGSQGNQNFTFDFCFKFNCSIENEHSARACHLVPDTICDLNMLNGLCGIMPNYLVEPGPEPLCINGSGTANNISWFAFKAGVGDYTLQVLPTACNTVGNSTGVQVGVYTDCAFTDSPWCQDTCSDAGVPINIPSSVLTPGKVYYLFLDGCSGSICTYEINILGNYQPNQLPSPIAIICDPEVNCDNICLNSTVDFSLLNEVAETSANYFWTIIDPDLVSMSITTTSSTIPITFSKLGPYTIRLDQVVAKCTSVVSNVSVQVNVGSPPNNLIQPNGLVLCKSTQNAGFQSIILNLDSNSPPNTIAWFPPQNIGGMVDSTHFPNDTYIIDEENSGVGNFTIPVQVTPADGCPYVDSLHVAIGFDTALLADDQHYLICPSSLPFTVFPHTFEYAVKDTMVSLVLNDSCRLTKVNIELLQAVGNLVIYQTGGGTIVKFQGQLPSYTGLEANFQWYRNGNPIASHPNDPRAVIASEVGTYHVEITLQKDGLVCTQTWEIEVDHVIVVDNDMIQIFEFAQNTTDDRLVIQGIKDIAAVKLFNINGQLLYSGNIKPNEGIDIHQFVTGIYIVAITEGENIQTLKWFKNGNY